MRVSILALMLSAAPLAAQMGGGGMNAPQAPRDTVRKVLTIPGQRDGNSMFALANYPEMRPRQWGVMDFQHYHTTAELNYWMQRWATEKPNLVELVQVGTSFGGSQSPSPAVSVWSNASPSLSVQRGTHWSR